MQLLCSCPAKPGHAQHKVIILPPTGGMTIGTGGDTMTATGGGTTTGTGGTMTATVAAAVAMTAPELNCTWLEVELHLTSGRA